MNVVLTALLLLVLPFAEKTPDPADVKPGWLALVIFLLMGVAVAVLAFSLVKHLGKARANFEEHDRDNDPEGGVSQQS